MDISWQCLIYKLFTEVNILQQIFKEEKTNNLSLLLDFDQKSKIIKTNM